MNAWRNVIRLATEPGTPKRALLVALVVGSALNLINQGDAIFGEGRVNWGKLLLTYLVPFAVSTHGAVSARWDHHSNAANLGVEPGEGSS